MLRSSWREMEFMKFMEMEFMEGLKDPER